MSRISESFETIYADAGPNLGSVPWAQLAPNSALLSWLDEVARRDDRVGNALVVGCGLGDDAEALAALGWEVTAFDVAPTAIDRCRQRFPNSSVDYVVADVTALPPAWDSRFDLVVEIRTLQCLVSQERAVAGRALAAAVATGGVIYLRCYRLEPGSNSPVSGPPWPLDEGDLGVFTEAGLMTEMLEQDLFAGVPGAERGPTFTAVYRRG